MKTTKSLSHKMKVGMAIAILAGALLSLASCKKEEVQPQATSQTAGDRQMNHSANALPLSYASIQINHAPMRPGKPAYIVTLTADGRVVFDGKRNVRFLGTKTFGITPATLIYINGLYMQFMTSITHDRVAGDEGLPVMDQVFTTWRAADSDKFNTRVDFDNGSPANLVSFRSRVEAALEIKHLINTSGPFPDDHEQQ